MRYFLVFLLFLVGIGAVYGGIYLIIDPYGSFMNMPKSFVESTPFSSFVIPGILLLALLGIFPLFTCFSLIAKPKWNWAGAFNIYNNMHWAWTYSLYCGIMLIIWIDVQIYFIGYTHIVQTICAFLGVAIVITALLPKVKGYYLVEK